MSSYYVYTHSDKDGNVFYVGKGTKRRAWAKNRSNQWLKKIKGGYTIHVPYTELTNNEALDLEALLIETYGIDTLVNKKKETPKQNRGTVYYDIIQKAKDTKLLIEMYNNFEHYYKIPFFKNKIQLMQKVYELRDEYI